MPFSLVPPEVVLLDNILHLLFYGLLFAVDESTNDFENSEYMSGIRLIRNEVADEYKISGSLLREVKAYVKYQQQWEAEVVNRNCPTKTKFISAEECKMMLEEID